MNPVFRAAAESIDLGWLMGGMTAFFLVFFLGWVAYAWWPGNRELMERASRLPLEED